MKNFFKNLCIILLIFAVVSLVFSCTSRGSEFESLISDTISGFESDITESSSTSMPEVVVNPFSELSLLFIGDSITDGAKGIESYTVSVKDNLGANKLYNYGVDWSTLAYIEDCHCHPNSDYNHHPFVLRYSNIEDADIICVFGGINDFGCLIPLGSIDDTEPTTFYGALNILAEGLKADHPDSYIFFMTGFNYYNNPDHENSIGVKYLDLNNAILNVCAKYEIDCFDVYNEIPFVRDTYTVDGIHPTEDFIKYNFAPKVADFIRENYKK